MTNIFTACKNGDLTQVKQQLRYSNVNSKNDEGDTPLYCATYSNHIHIVKYLLQNEADIHIICGEYGNSALICATNKGYTHIAKELLKNGSYVNFTDNSGRSALWCASSHGYTETVALLLENGAAINLANQDGSTPLYVASQNGHVKTVDHLIKYGADIDARFQTGATPLMAACGFNQIDVIGILILAGADVNAKTYDGDTAVHFAVEKGHTDAVKILLSTNVKLSANYNQQTPLDIAHEIKSDEIISLLIKYKDSGIASLHGFTLCLEGEVREMKNQMKSNTKDDSADKSDKIIELGSYIEKILEGIQNTNFEDSTPACEERYCGLLREVSNADDQFKKLSSIYKTEISRDFKDKHLLLIAQKLGKDWKLLGGFLELDLNRIKSFQDKYGTEESFAAWNMLVEWRNNSSGSTAQKKTVLRNALKDINRDDLDSMI